MKIIGFDPGTARVGWSVIVTSRGQISGYAFGCFTTPQSLDMPARLEKIFAETEDLLAEHTPDTVSIEELFFSSNVSTAISVGQSRGVLMLACARAKVPVVSYTPTGIKLALTGTGKADKKQIQFMITKLLKLSAPPEPDDAADAVAVALTHAFTIRSKTRGL